MVLFPEVERWLEDGTMGEHIRMVPVPRLHEQAVK